MIRNCVKKICFNEKNYVRAGWRILIGFLLFFTGLFLSLTLADLFSTDVGNIVLGITAPTLIALFLMVETRYLDNRCFKECGFVIDRNWWVDFLGGIIIGILVPFIVLCVYLATGWASFSGFLNIEAANPLTAFVPVFVAVAGYATAEEIFCRGYVIPNAIEGLKYNVLSRRAAIGSAWVISSVMFIYLHNLAITRWYHPINYFIGGLVLALPFLLTGRLAMPISMHVAYNFSNSYVFNTSESSNSIIELSTSGPDMWVGGTSLTTSFVWIVGAILIVLWVRWTHGSVGLHPQITKFYEEY